MKEYVKQPRLLVIWVSIAHAFLVIGCGRIQQDEGRALVNASGLSKDEVLNALSKSADVNKRSRTMFGWTPLISAIYSHKEEVVDLLISRGADVNLGDDKNQTPLVWAIEAWGDNTNLIQKLVQNGADPKIKNRYGSDAFTVAHSQTNSAEIVAILETIKKVE
jgi:ankyrin repeat protein